MNKSEIYSQLKTDNFYPQTIVDCGSAYGEWSTMIKNIWPESTLLGIDANKWTTNNIPGTDITEIAVLSDKDNKEMVFYRKKDHIDRGTFCTGDSLFIENTQHYQPTNTIIKNVKTQSLKSILKKHNLPKINLLKLDTQGSELLIMQGLEEEVFDIDFIEIETSLVEYNKNGCSFNDIIKFLENSFSIYDILDLHRHNNFYLCQVDILFQNKKSYIQKLI